MRIDSAIHNLLVRAPRDKNTELVDLCSVSNSVGDYMISQKGTLVQKKKTEDEIAKMGISLKTEDDIANPDICLL